MAIQMREECAADLAAIRRVNQLAFGQAAESLLVDALRDQGFVRLSLVAVDQGEVVGHILFSQMAIVTADGPVDALALAPLAVTPSRQRQGIGSALVREGLRQCSQQGHRIVLVVGHPAYYPRFGFSAALAAPLGSPYAGASFMALELSPGALDGVRGDVRYAPPFSAF